MKLLSNTRSQNEHFGHLQARLLWLGVLTTAVACVVAYIMVNRTAAAGVALGGIAGGIGLQLLSGRLLSLATIAPEKLFAVVLAGTFVRLLVYAAALIAAYYIDPVALHGFFGALSGIIVVRLVSMIAAHQSVRVATQQEPGRGDR